MEGCARAGVHYIDTSMYDEPDIFATDYEPQLKFAEQYAPKNVTGVLSIGFDPGVVNVFCAYAQKHHFDQIEKIDIIDCNAGDHGLPSRRISIRRPTFERSWRTLATTKAESSNQPKR